MFAAWAGAAGLAILQDRGFWGYVLAAPGSVINGRSFLLWFTHGLWPLALAAAFWAAAWGLGRRLLPRREDTLDEAAAAALGLGVLGLSAFLWASAAGFGRVPMLLFAALAAAAGWSALPAPRRPRLPDSPVAALLALAAAHGLITALAPPAEWDARAYHLALPELYLREGRLFLPRWMLHAHWPHLMELLYAWPLALGRDGAAALMHAGAAALLSAGTFAAARRAGAHEGAWFAALAVAVQPALARAAPVAHSDAACALLVLAAAAALSRRRERAWLAAAGFLAGSAAAVKLFGGAYALVWAVWLAAGERRPKDAALFAVCAAAAAGPWLLRSWLEAGDPFWPFLTGRLGLDRAAAQLAARNLRSNLWSWPPPGWLLTHRGPGFLLAPLAGIFMLGRGAKPASAVEKALWLPVPLLVLLAFRQHEAWRYMIPAFPAAALAMARFAEAAAARGRARRLAAGLLLLAAVSPITALSRNNALFAVAGARSAARPEAPPRELFEDRTVDVAAFYREARAALPKGARVLLFRETRGYGAGFDYLWGDPVNQAVIEYRTLAAPEALLRRLGELGVTHVLDHPGSTLYREDPLYYDARTLALMEAALRARARPVLEREGLVLRELL